MWNVTQRQVISTVGLVASDFAYKSQFSSKPGGVPAIGEVLSSFPDKSSPHDQGFPQGLLFSLANQPFAAYQYSNSGPNGVGVVKFLDWELLTVIEFPTDGFGAVIFKSKDPNVSGKFDYIVAMRGTDACGNGVRLG